MNIVIISILLPYLLDSGGAQAQFNIIDKLRAKHHIIRIGKGAVVCSGAVVTRDVSDYDVVGIPAKKIATRPNKLNYSCHWDVPFT